MGCKLEVAVVQMDAAFAPVPERLDRVANIIAEAVKSSYTR